uniref:DUF4132 domain-containing protein n=1 Tax=Parastrongyloides trichosuri TaxID=131310 RepID=A0A0N4ZLR1_PARTI
MMEENNELVDKGHFRGVKSTKKLSEKSNEQQNPENVYSKLYYQSKNNFQIKGDDFVTSILLPLEKGDENLIRMLKNDKDAINFILSLCGKLMPGVSIKNRNIILDRLWNVLEKEGFQIDLKTINTRLQIWSENDKPFNVKEMLHNLEIKRKLSPDNEFMIHMMNQLARSGLKDELSNFKNEFLKRGIFIGKEYELAEIRCASVKNMITKADSLIKSYIKKHGEEGKREAYSAAILGASQQLNFPRISSLLRKTMVFKNSGKNRNLVIDLDQGVLFDAIWNFVVMSSPSDEEAIVNLTEELLKHMNRDKGYFKLLNREAIRHISENYYYSGVTLIGETFRLKEALSNQEKNKFIMHLTRRLFNRMIRNRVEESKIKNIAYRLSTYTDRSYNLFFDLALSILTFKEYTNYERLDTLLAFIDNVDPNRERHHLILPMIVDSRDYQKNLPILFRWKNAGYTDLSKLDIDIINRNVITPFLNDRAGVRRHETDFNRLDEMTKLFKSFSIPEGVTWNWVLNLKKKIENSNSNIDLPCSTKNLIEWLQSTYDKTFPQYVDDDDEMEENEDEFKNKLEENIKNQKFNDVRRYVDDINTYRKVDISPYIDEILELYLKYGYWGQMMNFLTNISNYCKPLAGREDIITTKQLLRIVKKFVLSKNELDVSKAIELLYNIKTKFPYACAGKGEIYSTLNEVKEILYHLLKPPNKERLTEKNITDIQIFLTTLYKLDIIDLPRNETITPFFIQNVLKNSNWSNAVKLWLKFQSQLLCSNGLITLLKHALEFSGDAYQLNYIMLKAQTYMTESRINAYYISALMQVKRYSEAVNFIKKLKEPIKATDAFHVFALTNWMARYKYLETVEKDFLELCLEYTDLKNDENIMNLLVNDWLYKCESLQLGLYALEYQKLFNKYGYVFNESQLERISKISSESNSLINRWIKSDDEGLLNINYTNNKKELAL